MVSDVESFSHRQHTIHTFPSQLTPRISLFFPFLSSQTPGKKPIFHIGLFIPPFFFFSEKEHARKSLLCPLSSPPPLLLPPPPLLAPPHPPPPPNNEQEQIKMRKNESGIEDALPRFFWQKVGGNI